MTRGVVVRSLKFVDCLVVLAGLFASGSQAATLLADAEVIADTAALALGLPAAQTFTVTTAGQVEVRATDVGNPGPLSSLQVVVSKGSARVARLDTAGVTQFAAQPGEYKVQVIAAVAGTTPGSFTVDARTVATGASLRQFSGEVKGQAAAVAEPATTNLDDTFQVTQTGTYQVTLTDRNFPVALRSADLAILTGGSLVTVLPVPGCVSNCYTRSFTAAAGTYTIGGFLVAAGADQAGLYSLTVTGPGGVLVYGKTAPVGQLPVARTVTLPAGSSTLTLTDFAVPAALTTIKAVVAQGPNVLATASAAGATAVSGATAGTAQLYVFSRSNSVAAVGAYGVRIAQGTQLAYEDARALPEGYTAASGIGAYVFTGTVPAAGSYALQLRDQAFPVAFTTLRAIISQGGVLTQSVTTAGTTSLSLAAGPVSLLVFGTPPSLSSNSLFGISLALAAGGTPVLEQAQGVGGLFRTRSVTLASAGSYDFTLSDLGFPTNFAEVALAVMQGPTLRGQVFGAGKFTVPAATAGVYSLNVLARLGSNTHYGTWGVEAETTPLPPVMTFAATPASVAAQQTSSLQWSATDASSCTASGGWSGTKATSGTETTAALSANATYTLSCTGPGGSANRSVTVTVTAAGSGSGSGSGSETGGGGGSFDLLMLAGLGALLWQQRRRLQPSSDSRR